MSEMKLFAILPSLLLLCMAAVPGCLDLSASPPLNSLGSSLQQAHGAEVIGDYSSASHYYSKALEFDPGNSSALLGKSHALIVRKQYGEALNTSLRARAAAPQSALPIIYEGVALDSLGRHQEAVQAFADALAIDPNLTYVRNLQTVAIAGGELERNPENASAWFAEGSAYYSLDLNGSYLQPNARTKYRYMAFADLRNATRLNPDNGVAWEELGSLSLQVFDYTNATESFRKSLAIDPENGGAWYGLAEAYKWNGRILDKVTTIESGIARVPDSPKLWLARAQAFSSLHYSRERNQSVDLGTYSSLNVTDETIRSYDMATSLDPGNDKAFEQKARFLSNIGRYDGAITAWQAELALNRETSLGKANIYADIGDAYYKLRNFPASRQAYEEAIRLYPDHERAIAGRDMAANPPSWSS